MIIKSVELQNFRNYGLEKIEFDENTNILYGDNAQGKTNVLEALFLSGTTKSHRGSKDSEMILFDHEEAHIKTILCKKGIDYRIDMHIKKNKAKGIAVNGIPIRKSLELYGIVNIVFFSPEDLQIIKSGPSGRRKFMDMELCQLDKIYADALVNYGKALDQKNRLLKDMYFQKDTAMLDIWDAQLVKFGREIIRTRQEFILKLNEIIRSIHSNLTGGKELLEIQYEPSVAESDFEKIIFADRERDLRTKVTSHGPHRDDIIFSIGGIDIRKYGSQGQQRTTALSLKLAEIELVKNTTGDTPVLLLDDVLSELDGNRQNQLLQSIKEIQTMITCTGLDDFISNNFHIGRLFRVTEGHVQREN